MCHRIMTVARINEYSAPLDSVHRDSTRVALYSGSMDKGSFFFQFWKLGFCSVSECEIFAHKGQLEGDCRSSPHIRDVSICTMKCRRRQCHYVSNHVMEHFYVQKQVAILLHHYYKIYISSRYKCFENAMYISHTQISSLSNLLLEAIHQIPCTLTK